MLVSADTRRPTQCYGRHVAHHIDCSIPHYHAREATDAIAAAFPKAYLYEPSPIHVALWRVASNCIAVARRSATDSRYVFVPLEQWRSIA